MKIILTPEEYHARVTKIAQDTADEGAAWVKASRRDATMFVIVAGFLVTFSFGVPTGVAFAERMVALAFIGSAGLVILGGRRIQRGKLAVRQELLEQMRANLKAVGYEL